MNNKLIFIPFTFDTAKKTGNNMRTVKDPFETYCKNICVALVSLKKENPDCDVALVTDTLIPHTYMDVMKNNEILIYNAKFQYFTFPDEFPWSLAFYKLSALKTVYEEYIYDYYCYLDADIVANRPLTGVWKEAQNNILLYDINHGYNVPNYVKFLDQAALYYGEVKNIVQYGGEFFAANRNNTQIHIEECEKVYHDLIDRNINFSSGDEFIVALSAHNNKNLIKNAGSYIYRFWTGSFRLISTCYKFNPVSILHLPDEKNNGIIKIYDKYIAKGRYPSKESIYRLCHLSRSPLKVFVKSLVSKIGL